MSHPQPAATRRRHLEQQFYTFTTAPADTLSPIRNQPHARGLAQADTATGISQGHFEAPIVPSRPRRQSQLSSLAKAAMANQLAASNSHTSPPSVPQSIQEQGVESRSYATTPTSVVDAVSNPNTGGLAHDGASSAKSSSPTGSETNDSHAQSAKESPFTPPDRRPSTQANPSTLANALRAINDDAPRPGTAVREPPVPSNASPYTKSISSTAPASPRIPPVRQNSGTQTPRVRPHATTLSIPGMTRSNISPDGKISDRDIGSKLVIIMVGLPARGKSYITKKIKRYLSWQQHNTRIFNVGNRRRVAVGTNSPAKPRRAEPAEATPQQVAKMLLDGAPVHDQSPQQEPSQSNGNGDKQNVNGNGQNGSESKEQDQSMEQSANFFDPKNASASKIREQVAIDTLDELLDFLISGGGSVGILDATNSTIERRQGLFDHIKAREPKIGILFIESVCKNPDLLEANMRLKLSGPDYKDKDPHKSLEDFKERVRQYESAYVPLGDYEEEHGMQYIKMTDVGKKLTHFGLEGFLSGGIAHYLSSFNLAPRQIWITRHGQSFDNQLGKLGGNSELTERGHFYGLSLYKFITHKRKEWLVEQRNKIAQSSFPPQPGDKSPPYPELNRELDEKNTCVWTSMLKRSIQTAEYFEADEDYDVKAWEMLNELNAGTFEGMTYEEIARNNTSEYTKRQHDKLHYVYPGVGGEGYLQIISRLRDMVREMERIKDHVLIIGHRSVCRVLMAYFMDLTRDDIADLDVPLGMLYAIEPKPYGIDFHAYKYNESRGWFDEVPGYKPQKAIDQNA